VQSYAEDGAAEGHSRADLRQGQVQPLHPKQHHRCAAARTPSRATTRGPDAYASPNRSRATLTTDFRHETATLRVNPTCGGSAGIQDKQRCGDAKDIEASQGIVHQGNKFKVEQDKPGGEVKFKYQLGNSRVNPGPSISGEVRLSGERSGDNNSLPFTFESKGDAYPSREAYWYDDHGQWLGVTLYDRKQRNPRYLFPSPLGN
jgi:hypothetical protein